MKRYLRFPIDSVDEGGVNLTPLIDVVFVVLILFILVSPLVEVDQIQLAPATTKRENQTSFQEGDAIKVYVDKDNTISMNGRALTLDELFFNLEELYKRDSTAIPQLYHDSRAYFGTYQSVKNAFESAGFESLDLILKPPSH